MSEEQKRKIDRLLVWAGFILAAITFLAPLVSWWTREGERRIHVSAVGTDGHLLRNRDVSVSWPGCVEVQALRTDSRGVVSITLPTSIKNLEISVFDDEGTPHLQEIHILPDRYQYRAVFKSET